MFPYQRHHDHFPDFCFLIMLMKLIRPPSGATQSGLDSELVFIESEPNTWMGQHEADQS